MTSQNFLGYNQPTPSDAPQPEEPSSQDVPEQQQPPNSYTPQSVRPEDPEAPRMPSWKPNTAVYQGPAGSESVLKLMEDSDLNLDFLDANRDVLELSGSRQIGGTSPLLLDTHHHLEERKGNAWPMNSRVRGWRAGCG